MKRFLLLAVVLSLSLLSVSAKEKEIKSMSVQGIGEMVEILKTHCSVIEDGMRSLADLKKGAEKALALEETNAEDSDKLNDILEYCEAIGSYYKNKLEDCRAELAFYEMLKNSGETAVQFQGGLEKNLEIFKKSKLAKEAVTP
ncbi:MAG: hypothetical protein PHN74_02355 [Candidatus Pacebacteria bacterium]|nr:hypothetical protein [Candidatus Paceibacterota bacterium]